VSSELSAARVGVVETVWAHAWLARTCGPVNERSGFGALARIEKEKASTPLRLNWGCGGDPRPGWINSDAKEIPGVDICCDIRDTLPIDDNSFDYAVSIHALPEVPYDDLIPVLRELQRVLKVGGTLRLSLPDVERSFSAFQRRDRDFFLIPDEEWTSLGSKLIVQLIWYGYSKTLFVRDFAEELLLKAGFSEIYHVAYHQTATSYPEIVELDNREKESLFIEAVK
jgi:predicted SAM-dependent methyltransferase